MVDQPEQDRESAAEQAGKNPKSGPASDVLGELSQAFAQMLGPGQDESPDEGPSGDETARDETAADASGEVTPRGLVEALLFVGHPEGKPITSQQVADLMRGVDVAEVDAHIRALNADYAADGCPYEIVSDGDGYRMTLRKPFARIRQKFYGRLRRSRLSVAAIEVLALVAYRQPLTIDQVSKARGKSSGQILAQLVRRGLVRVERVTTPRRITRYHTTRRFLDLFGLESLGDMPQSEEVESR